MTWYKIAKLFEAIEMRLIASLKRNLAAHKRWERDEGFDWPAWQSEKIRHMEAFRRENAKIMAEYEPIIDDETQALMDEQEQEGAALAREEYETLTGEPADKAEFFHINRPRMERLMEDITGAEERAETSALRMTDDVYRRTLYQAELAMASGSMTPQQAIDMATRDFLSAGINSIEYRDGRRVNIASYAEMALRTAATRSFLQGAAKQRQALGINTVLVSQYGACSETCLPWQGKVYIDDVFANFAGQIIGERGQSSNGRWYPLLSTAIRGGLFHPNCRHTVSTWIEGISTLPPPIDKEKVRETANLEERQRALERKVRKYKRLKTGSMSIENSVLYGKKLRETQKELREFISAHSDVLRRDYWRERNIPSPYAAAKDTMNTGRSVQFDPEFDYAIRFEDLPEPVNAGLSNASRKVAEMGGKDGKEHMILVNLETGNADYVEDGDEHSVGGMDYIRFINEHSKEKFAFIHNHNTDGFLSETDMRTLLTTDCMSIMAAVRNDSVKYVVRKTRNAPNLYLFDKLYPEDIQPLNERYRNGIITAGERTIQREWMLVNNLIRDYTEGLVMLDGRK